jgi:hypothetical protein
MQNPAIRPCVVATAGLIAAVAWAAYRAPATPRLEIVSHAQMQASAFRAHPDSAARDTHSRAGRRRAVVRDLISQLRLGSLLRH